jgi:hypothetical protein
MRFDELQTYFKRGRQEMNTEFWRKTGKTEKYDDKINVVLGKSAVRLGGEWTWLRIVCTSGFDISAVEALGSVIKILLG